MNPADITSIDVLFGTLCDNGFNYYEVVEYLDDVLSQDLKDKIINEVSDAYNEIVSSMESLEDAKDD